MEAQKKVIEITLKTVLQHLVFWDVHTLNLSLCIFIFIILVVTLKFAIYTFDLIMSKDTYISLHRI